MDLRDQAVAPACPIEPVRVEAESKRVRPWWEWVALGCVLVVAVGLRVWNLPQNGLCNLYFSAGVRSMMQSWHNFFYASFDPGGFLTIDKPPVAYWIQTAGSKVLGFNSYGLLLPQVVAGAAVVLLVYLTVRRTFGAMAGLISGLVLAVTPLSVAMDRHNNADSLMVFFLVLAACATLRATERGNLKWLMLGMTAVGVAFNTKMLLAYVALPALTLLYFAGAPVSWKARFGHLVLGGLVLGVVSLSWPLAVDLTPAEQRPYVGSTKDNSMLSLALGWNGMARLTGKGRHLPFGGGREGLMPGRFPFPQGGNGNRGGGVGDRERPPQFGPGPGGPGGGMFGIGSPGPMRFATRNLSTQIAWLWPLCLLGGWAAATGFKVRFPLGPEHRQILFWSSWALTMAAVFSWAKGITHSYYTLQMAPPLAALAGISITGLWAEVKRGAWRGWILPVLLLGEAVWAAYLLAGYSTWDHVLKPILWGGVGLGVLALLVALVRAGSPFARGVGGGGLALALVAILAAPAAWSVTPCLVAASATQPSAGPGLLSHTRGPMDFDHALERSEPLVAYLRQHRAGEKWLVATANTTEAAPLIVLSGEPVMALGGWQGSEPAISQADLKQKIRAHELRYVLVSSFGGRSGDDSLFHWIRDNATPVPKKRWQSKSATDRPGMGLFGFGGMGFGGAGLYDCSDAL